MKIRSRYLPVGIAAAIVLVVATSAPALANDIRVTVPNIGPGQLQNLQNRQQRQLYQQRQQINRELDSQAARQRQPRVDVPVMRPGCVPRQVGGTYGSC